MCGPCLLGRIGRALWALRPTCYQFRSHDRSSTRELAEVASDQVASWAAPGLPSKLRFPASTSDARRVFCVYDNRLSERPTGLNFSIEDLRVEYCDDIVYGYVGLDSSATNIRSKLPKYDFLDEGFKR